MQISIIKINLFNFINRSLTLVCYLAVRADDGADAASDERQGELNDRILTSQHLILSFEIFACLVILIIVTYSNLQHNSMIMYI